MKPYRLHPNNSRLNVEVFDRRNRVVVRVFFEEDGSGFTHRSLPISAPTKDVIQFAIEFLEICRQRVLRTSIVDRPDLFLL